MPTLLDGTNRSSGRFSTSARAGKKGPEMIRITRRAMRITAAGAALALAAAACSSGSTGGGTTSSTGSSGPAVKGGTLNMLGSGDIDFMDPNISYYSIGSLNLRM